MGPSELEIITYLNKEFCPELILLGGSRALGQEHPDSDWDLYLIGDYAQENQRIARNLGKAHLDIALFPSVTLTDNILRIYYGPIKGLKPMWDNSTGDAQAIAIATAEAYQRGPGYPSDERKAELIEDASRILSKINRHASDSVVATFHMSSFYRLTIHLWFELQGTWSVPPQEAFPIIRQEDPEFAEFFRNYADGTLAEKLRLCSLIFDRLLDISRA